jgi:tetratricopeptide (TPR) repeat protein
MIVLLLASLLVPPLLPAATPAPASEEPSVFRMALDIADKAIAAGDKEGARHAIQRALERDPRSIEAWEMRARWARAVEDRDELVWSLHKRYDMAVAQKRDKAAIAALRAELVGADPFAEDLLGMRALFMQRLVKIAQRYEKEDRPHGAIEVWKKVLALDPENVAAAEAIDRIASRPDPSLAGDAKPKDLFADVSEEWIREFDE